MGINEIGKISTVWIIFIYSEIYNFTMKDFFVILQVIRKRLKPPRYEMGKILKEIKLLTYNNIDMAQIIKNALIEQIKKRNQLGLLLL